MFTFGVPELLIIFVIVILLFGGKRIPEIGRALGKSIREFKSATGKDKDEISTWIKDEKEATSADTTSDDDDRDVLREKMEDIPGVKEAKEIKKTANKIKAASRFFLKK